MKKIILAAVTCSLLAGCSREADVASYNLSRAADEFEVNRRIVFYNGITGAYILVIEGLCSLGNYDSIGQLTVTCKTGPGQYKKHFLGLSDNVTFFAEQVEPASVDILDTEKGWFVTDMAEADKSFHWEGCPNDR